jgi:putative transposase
MLMQYRRARVEGGTYFFTVVTHLHRGFSFEAENVEALREAFRLVMAEYPFRSGAMVVLPEHLTASVPSVPFG